MAIEVIIKEARQVAEKEAKKLGLGITSFTLDAIGEEIDSNQEIIEESLIKKEKTHSDIYESVKILIHVASKIAKEEDYTSIYSSHVKNAMKKTCPTSWPFC